MDEVLALTCIKQARRDRRTILKMVRRSLIIPPSTHPTIDGNVNTKDPNQSRATVRAMPMPPPMHSVARPFLALRRFISCTSVVNTRAPEAPIG